MENKNYLKNKPYMTIGLIIVNVVVFLLLTTRGMTEDPEFMLAHGAMYVPYVTENGETYRLFTSMFLHFGFEHLMNNMFVLGVMGAILEPEMGRIKYLIVYLASGLCGNILSAVWDIQAGSYAVSAGASGAVFGVIGALLLVAIRNRGRVGTVTGKGLIFMILLSLYYGFTSTGVDNAAHIGGLVSGFFLALLLYRKRKRNYRSGF